MKAHVLNVLPGGDYSVVIECLEKETLEHRTVCIKGVPNEITAVPFSYTEDSMRKLEKNVLTRHGKNLIPLAPGEMYRWEERTICSDKRNLELEGKTENRLIFHVAYSESRGISEISSARRMSKEFISPVEAFILLLGIKGPTLLDIKNIVENTANMSSIERIGYFMPDLNIAYVYSAQRSVYKTVSVFLHSTKERKESTYRNSIKRLKAEETETEEKFSPALHTTFTTQKIMEIEEALNSNIFYCESSEAIAARVAECVRRIKADMVVAYNVDLDTFKKKVENKPNESNHQVSLLCDLVKYIESVNRLPEYTLEEMGRAYGIDKSLEENDKTCEGTDETTREVNEARRSTLEMHRIFRKGDLLSLGEKLARVTGAQLNYIFNGYKSDRVEYLLLHRMREHKYLIPKISIYLKGDGKDTYEGGHVFLDKPGVYNESYIALFDFNSLYPSIIQEYNVCFSTAERLTMEKRGREGKTLLPGALKDLVEQRKEIKSRMAREKENLNVLEIEQKAVKLVANCVYGCLGFKGFRFYNKKMAAFITECGRSILKDTKLELENRNYRVIYGDTDSVMVDTRIKLSEGPPSKELIQEIEECISKKYLNIKLGFEKVFTKLVMLAKKKYFGLYLEEGAERIEEKGLETGRRDWSEIARNTTSEVMKALLHSSEPEREILKTLSKFRENLKIFKKEQFLIRKKIQKTPESYGSIQTTSLPQVALALRLKQEKGLAFYGGEIISYVMAVHNGITRPEIVSESGEIDHEYYIKMQVFPPIQRMLEVFPNFPMESIQRILGIYKPANRPVSYAPQEAEPEAEPVEGLEITTSCCKNTQEIGRSCRKCRGVFTTGYLREAVRALVYSQSLKLHTVQRHCVRCGIKDDCSPFCHKCHLPTEWESPPLENFHKALYRLQEIFIGTEIEKYIVDFLSISDYLAIDIRKFPLNGISLHLYIPSLVGRRDLLDSLFK